MIHAVSASSTDRFAKFDGTLAVGAHPSVQIETLT
jgi:hypothetical protein